MSTKSSNLFVSQKESTRLGFSQVQMQRDLSLVENFFNQANCKPLDYTLCELDQWKTL